MTLELRKQDFIEANDQAEYGWPLFMLNTWCAKENVKMYSVRDICSRHNPTKKFTREPILHNMHLCAHILYRVVAHTYSWTDPSACYVVDLTWRSRALGGASNSQVERECPIRTLHTHPDQRPMIAQTNSRRHRRQGPQPPSLVGRLYVTV